MKQAILDRCESNLHFLTGLYSIWHIDSLRMLL